MSSLTCPWRASRFCLELIDDLPVIWMIQKACFRPIDTGKAHQGFPMIVTQGQGVVAHLCPALAPIARTGVHVDVDVLLINHAFSPSALCLNSGHHTNCNTPISPLAPGVLLDHKTDTSLPPD